MKLFVDTHIFVDYFLDRSDNIRPLGEFAFQLVRRTISCEFYMLVSDGAIKELKNVLNKKEDELIEIVFKELISAGKVQFIEASEHQISEARLLAEKRQIPRTDALFAILARDNAAILVSRDKHHQEMEDIVEALKPEELLSKAFRTAHSKRFL